MATLDFGSPRKRTTADRVFRMFGLLAVAAILVWVLWYLRDLVLFLLIGFILAYVITPVVDWFQQFGISRALAVVVTFILAIGLVGFAVAFLIPFVAQQASGLAQIVSEDRLVGIAQSIERALLPYLPIPEGSFVTGLQRASAALFEQQRITGTVTYLVDLFANILYATLIVPFAMFFFMRDGRAFRDYVLRLVPNRYLEITVDTIDKVESGIGSYIGAMLIRAIIVSILVWLLLWFTGLRYAATVGIFTGIVNTIPYFGPIIGFAAGAVVAIAQTSDFSLVIPVALVMAVIQFLDAVVFQPLFFSRAASTHPLLVLIVVLIGAELAGILGMLLAVPALTILVVVVSQIGWGLKNFRIFKTG